MALTKNDIVKMIIEMLNFSPIDAKDILEDLLEIMKSTLASDLVAAGH